ncbi:MAG: hypothetical protein WC551_05595 [Patescibacteria group bacterium]
MLIPDRNKPGGNSPESRKFTPDDIAKIRQERDELKTQLDLLQRKLNAKESELTTAIENQDEAGFPGFAQPLKFPFDWEVKTEIGPKFYSDRPPNFEAMARRVKQGLEVPFGSDRMLDDLRELGEGEDRWDKASNTSEETLRQIADRHYPGWKPKDFADLFAAAKGKQEVESTQDFDLLSASLEKMIERINSNARDYYTGYSVAERIRTALAELVSANPESAAIDTFDEEAMAEALDETVTDDEEGKRILFMGKPIFEYEPGDYGSAKKLDKRTLREGLDEFLHIHMPLMKRK